MHTTTFFSGFYIIILWRNISAKIRVYTVFVSRGTLFVNWYRKYISRGTLYTLLLTENIYYGAILVPKLEYIQYLYLGVLFLSTGIENIYPGVHFIHFYLQKIYIQGYTLHFYYRKETLGGALISLDTNYLLTILNLIPKLERVPSNIHTFHT